jgi:biopolymer transport protein ExbD
MAFAAGGGKGRPRSDINITPLVDVVLVLLIIFMVMTPILLKQLDVKVPEKSDSVDLTPQLGPSPVVLKITAEGQLLLNSEPLARAQLADRVREVLAPRREKLVFFDVEDQANYGLVVEVFDTVRGAGAKTLGIMTK